MNKTPNSWHSSWDDLLIDMQVCASSLLYNRDSWNRKPDFSNPQKCEDGVEYVSISAFVNFDF